MVYTTPCRINRMSQALAVFRNLMRARKQAFAGDPSMLVASAQEIRSKFEVHFRQIAERASSHAVGGCRVTTTISVLNTLCMLAI